jgi:Uracil DNA glycosylase
MKWKELDFWKSGEWQVCDERLRDLEKDHIAWCPGRRNMFASMRAVDFDSVSCVLVGQDPYPNPAFATGIAFSIPSGSAFLPPTLAMIFKELQNDIHGMTLNDGDLTSWCKQGVLLWNCIPTCTAWKSKSHNWPEWEELNKEVFQKLSSRDNLVFAFLGATAKNYMKYVDDDKSISVWASHPSPRGNMNSQQPFLGSRIFTTINMHLEEFGKKPIDWRL